MYDVYDVFLCTMYFCVQCRLIKGSLEVKLPTIWTDEKAEVGRVREEKKKEDQRRERVRRKKMQVREGVEKSRNTVCFPMFWGSGGSKGRLAKAAGAEPSGEMRDKKLHAAGSFLQVEMSKKCTRLCSEAHVQVKSVKN